MTRLIALSTALGLTIASGASAMVGMPTVPSLWPAEGTFGTPRAAADTVTRAQTRTVPEPAPKPAHKDQ